MLPKTMEVYPKGRASSSGLCSPGSQGGQSLDDKASQDPLKTKVYELPLFLQEAFGITFAQTPKAMVRAWVAQENNGIITEWG